MAAEPSNVCPPPLAIPGFQFLEKIGEGGMGTVYRAVQLSLQRPVAIKVLHAATEDGAGPAFQRETRLMASLVHPNVVTIYDCGQLGGHSYLVAEYVPGCTLRSLLQPGQPWPVPRAAAVLDRIADALAFIHQNGILHLDLKPENVLCGPDGQVKIADFGLALPRVDARVLAERGLAQGTIDYCSLEQRNGLQTDERSDLFSLAVLAYELLTGHLPGRMYEPASQLNPRLPAAVDPVLRRGLARHPEERYPSVAAFHRELAAALKRRRHGLLWTAVGLVGLTLLAAVVVKLMGPAGTPSEPGAEGPGRTFPGWMLYDRVEELRQIQGADPASLRQHFPEASSLRVEGPYPDVRKAPPVPVWPAPRPVFVWKTPEGLGFYHPVHGGPSGWDLVARAARPGGLPHVKPEDNGIAAGDFSGDRPLGLERSWRPVAPAGWQNGDHISVEAPPDRADNPALLLVKKDPIDPGRPVSCYQWLARVPARPGALMVLRYRARAREPGGRLAVTPELPLTMARADQTPAADWLRARSSALAPAPAPADTEVRLYRLDDAVTPSPAWQTYYVLWEWPAYCVEADRRNLVIRYTGRGEVWVDDVELFPWEEGAAE